MALIELAGAFAGGGGVTIVVGVFRDWLKTHSEDRRSGRDIDFKIEEHRDRLALDLLTAAREERAVMRAEVDRLRLMAAHLDDFDMALAHIQALLTAENPRQRKAIEASARNFLDRVKRDREEAGAFRNESQAAVAEARTAARG